MTHGSGFTETIRETLDDLPLLRATPAEWAGLVCARLDLFLADHAVCEQQAALSALNLVAHYPDDAELVTRMTALAAEEVIHLRRVATLLHSRGLHPSRRRPNPYVQGLQRRVQKENEGRVKLDRLLVGALIEARSCERFTLVMHAVGARDPEVRALLADLGPAEKRHWELFHRLAARDVDPAWFAAHWRSWLEYEADLAADGGKSPRVHG